MVGTSGRSWKKWAQTMLEQQNLDHRVFWKDHLPLHAYADWIKVVGVTFT